MLLHFFLRERQGEDKFRSDTFRADDIDVFVVRLNDLFDDRQTESGALLILAS